MFFKTLKKIYPMCIAGFVGVFILLQLFACAPIKKLMKPKPIVDKPQVFFREGDEVRKGSTVPTFIANTTKNKIIDTSDFEGKVIMLNFWSIRCGPCIKEMPYLEKLYEEFNDQGLDIFAINTDQATEEEITAFINSRDFTVSYDVVADPDLVLSSVFTKWFVPVTILIDSKGVMRYNNTGFTKRDYGKYKKIIKKLIKK